MDYKVKKNNNATAELTIHFTAEQLDAGFDKAYEKNRDKVKVPGFRPGKAPLDRIKKLLGDSVFDDAVNFTLNDAIIEIFPKLDPKPFRFPRFTIEDEKLDRTKGFTAKAIYDTFPEVSLPKYKKVKVDSYTVVPSNADIQKELESIQKDMARNVLKEDGEEIQATNLIEMNYRFAPESEPLPEQTHTGKYHLGHEANPPGFDEHILGMKVGEKKTFNFVYPKDFPASPESAGKTFQYDIEITAGYTITYPEIDDDFASEHDGSENLDELKTKIRNKLAEVKTEEVMNYTLNEIYDKLIEEGKFIIPESLIQEEADSVFKSMFAQYGVPPISMEEYAKQVGTDLEETRKIYQATGLKRLQAYFLRMKIAEEEKIQITEEDFQEKMKELAGAFREDLETFTKRMTKEDRISAIRENFLLEKVDKFVHNAVEKKSPKTITIEEASKILKREKKTT